MMEERLSEAQLDARAKMLEDLTARFESLSSKVACSMEFSAVKQSIFATIRAGSVFQLEQYLSAGLFSVHERDYQMCSPLHIAAFEGREDMVCVLLAHGADVFAVDKKGRTAKDVADSHRYSSVSKRLLSYMSDVKGVDIVEDDPLHSPLCSNSELMSLTQVVSSMSVASGHLPELRPSTYSTVSDDHSLILCLVGLPGRGKSFISRRISRYLNWKGVPCKVFNVGDYRRRFLGVHGTSSADFFDPTNKAAKDAREKMAEFATEDLIDFMISQPVCVGILDATNTTRERRAHLMEKFKSMSVGGPVVSDSVGDFGFEIRPTKFKTPVRVVFVESICHNEDIITENILRAKCGNDDFKGISPQAVISEFRDRIHQYEKVYETLDVNENGGKVSFIQIIDAKERIVLNNIRGSLQSKVSYFLMSLHPVAYPVFVSLPAETVGDVAGQFGGDPKLTANGLDYIGRLRAFIRARLTAAHGKSSPLRILCSYSPQVEQTVRLVLDGIEGDESPLDVVTIPLRALDDINYGGMAGLTVEEAVARHPKTSGLLFQPPALSPQLGVHESHESQPDLCLNECAVMPAFAYTVSFVRGGESTRQVNVRIEPALLEIMRADGPVMVIADPTPAKGVLAFVTDELPEHNQKMVIPRHGVVEVGVKTNRIVHLL